MVKWAWLKAFLRVAKLQIVSRSRFKQEKKSEIKT